MKDTIKEWVKQVEQVDRPAKERVLLEFASRLKYLASRFASRVPFQVDVEDLIQAGMIGLMDAMEKFDPSKGAQFKTYAEFRIRGAMLDEIRGMDWVPRSVREKVSEFQRAYRELEKRLGRPVSEEEVASALEMRLDEFWDLLQQVKGATFISVEDLGIHQDAEQEIRILVMDREGKNPLSQLLSEDVKKVLGKAIDQLPEKERLVVSLYYYDELTMKEIGKVLNITESRVSQLHTQALFRLKGKLREWKNS